MYICVDLEEIKHNQHSLVIYNGDLLFDQELVGRQAKVIALQKGIRPEIRYQRPESAKIINFSDYFVTQVSIYEN